MPSSPTQPIDLTQLPRWRPGNVFVLGPAQASTASIIHLLIIAYGLCALLLGYFLGRWGA